MGHCNRHWFDGDGGLHRALFLRLSEQQIEAANLQVQAANLQIEAAKLQIN